MMKFLKKPRLRSVDRPLEYAPDAQLRRVQTERSVPRPAHLGIR